jgi:hypothetical protein
MPGRFNVPMHLRLGTFVAAGALLLAACGSSDAAAPPTPHTIGGIGALPGTVPTDTAAVDPGSIDDDSSAAVIGAAPNTLRVLGRLADEERPIGRIVEGNKVLVIGDSILASISNRYGNQLCDRLVPRGWEVQVDAEVSRFIEFGRHVVEEHRGERWDAAVVMLGNNYDGDAQAFGDELGRLLDELAAMPVVLLNVTRFEPRQDEVNFVLTMAANEREGVRLLDWASWTADDTPGSRRLLAGDGLHLSPAGQEALASLISRELGRAPAGSFGSCRPSPFTDDSGGRLSFLD